MKDLSDFLKTPLRLEPDNFTFNMWGGSWIPHLKGLPSKNDQPVGESWEFSGHRNHPSRIFIGGEALALPDLLKHHAAQVLGESVARRFNGKTPFLLKLIDPREDLSVQVHPNDEMAARLENDSGKAEAWVILETAVPDACLYLGFSPEKAAGFESPAHFEEAFLSAILEANGKGPSQDSKVRQSAERIVLPFLNKIPVKAGEVYYVRPGAIHAIGQGVRLFEIQQSSDTTYRVWDWNRPDADKLKQGKLEFRPLHLERSKQALDFTPRPAGFYRVPSQGNVLLRDDAGNFAAERIPLDKSGARLHGELKGSFNVLTVLKGRVEVGKLGAVKQGHSVLIPAAAESFEVLALEGPTEIIKSYVP